MGGARPDGKRPKKFPAVPVPSHRDGLRSCAGAPAAADPANRCMTLPVFPSRGAMNVVTLVPPEATYCESRDTFIFTGGAESALMGTSAKALIFQYFTPRRRTTR
jgi:hypothetical protein